MMNTKTANKRNQINKASKKKSLSSRPLEKPNKKTISAMLEAERIAKDPNVKGYQDMDELFRELKK